MTDSPESQREADTDLYLIQYHHGEDHVSTVRCRAHRSALLGLLHRVDVEAHCTPAHAQAQCDACKATRRSGIGSRQWEHRRMLLDEMLTPSQRRLYLQSVHFKTTVDFLIDHMLVGMLAGLEQQALAYDEELHRVRAQEMLQPHPKVMRFDGKEFVWVPPETDEDLGLPLQPRGFVDLHQRMQEDPDERG